MEGHLCIGLHSRQLSKMLHRDTVVGGVAMTSRFAVPTFIVTYTSYVHSNDIETITFLNLAIHAAF